MTNNITERFQHVNPLQLDDALRGLTTSVRRLLDYERYLDGLEHLKMRDQSLPAAVERQVGRFIQGNVTDAETMERLALEFAKDLEDLGVFEALFASKDARVAPGSLQSMLEKQADALEDWFEQRGMPSSTWRWAIQYANWEDVGARIENGVIVVTQRGHTIGVITAAREARVDAASFAARAYGLPPTVESPDVGGKPFRLSASELLEFAMQELTSFYRRRARRTALDGVQVLPTGIWWVVVVVVIALFLIAAGASITILCSIGSITNRGVCDLGLALLLIGFLVLFVGGAGAKKTKPDPEDPDPGIPDPPG